MSGHAEAATGRSSPMTHEECLDLVEAMLGSRLRQVFGSRTVGCNANLAAVFASAIAIDLRLKAPKSDPARRLASLADGEVSDLGDHLAAAFGPEVIDHGDQPDLEFELPFGSVVEVWFGVPSIGEEFWVTEHGRTGLVPYLSVGRAIASPNLKKLRSHIRKLVSNHPCRAIGLPSEFWRAGFHERSRVQFPPFAEAGGVVLLCDPDWGGIPFEAAPQGEIRSWAKSLAFTMRGMWRERPIFATIAEWIGEVAHATAARIDTTVSAIIIDCGAPLNKMQPEFGLFATYIAYDGLDDALRRGLVLEPIEDPWSYMDGELVLQRRQQLSDLREVGANGRITALARWVAKASPLGVAGELARLAEQMEIGIVIPLGASTLFARLWWSNGVIEAEVEIPPILKWSGTEVQVTEHGIPETRKRC